MDCLDSIVLNSKIDIVVHTRYVRQGKQNSTEKSVATADETMVKYQHEQANKLIRTES